MIERITDVHDLHRDFITKRIPCIITSIPDELSCLKDFRDFQHLSEHVGKTLVSVEPISNRGTFGTAATKETMSFATFLKQLQMDEKVYLTTQYSEEEDQLIITEPLASLKKRSDFPTTPTFVHNLVTAKINLWLGASTTGTSSGLHHDFHDNIYVLLAGVKRFRIFKPSWRACHRLKIHGRPHEIFENGLISYDPNLCSDGLTMTVKAQIRVEICEKALALAQSSGRDTTQAEAKYEEAMDGLLESRLQCESAGEDGDFDSEVSPSDDEIGESHDLEHLEDLHDCDGVQGSLLSHDPEALAELRPPSRAAQTPDLSPITETSEPEHDTADDSEPPSFSKLSTVAVGDLLTDPGSGGEEFELKAGELLYLPASYFHEVISLSGTHDFHMAMNWWFYPPDAGDGSYIDKEIMAELSSRNGTIFAQQGSEDDPPAHQSKRLKTS